MITNNDEELKQRSTFVQGIVKSSSFDSVLFSVDFQGGYGHASITFITFNWVFLYSQRMSYETRRLTHVQIVIVLMCVCVRVCVLGLCCVCVCAPASVTAQTNASFSSCCVCCCCCCLALVAGLRFSCFQFS